MAAQPKPLPVHQPSYLEGGGIVGWLTTIDHKRVAVMYLASALFFMTFGGLEAMAIRVQLWTPDNHALSAAVYNAFFTMHGTTMVFLVVMPLLLGFLGNFLIPLAFPPLTIGLIFLLFDRFFDTHFYIVSAGATPILWQHLFWLFGHPEVYIMALPAFGIISEVIPAFSRKPLFGYPMMAYSICLIAFLSYGVWGHH